jgi:methionyl-tRNA formyltransferase
VFFASSDFSIPALEALRSHAAELLEGGTCTVVTPADKPTGRGQVITSSPFKLAALRSNFSVVQLPIDINFKMSGWELPRELHGKVDVGVVVSFGYMLPASLISLFPCGVINIHPSLLPRYRGSSPIQFALAQGDRQTGVSIIDVHPTHIDGGNIIDQSRMDVPRDATFESLAPVLAKQGAQQLIDVLRNLPEKQRASKQQDLSTPSSPALVDPRSSAPRIPKSGGSLPFLHASPETLWRIYAACKGFTTVYTRFRGVRMAVVEAIHPAEAAEKLAAAQQTTLTSASTEHFPSFSDATALGAGAVFYEPRLAAIGVICASNTLATPSVFYLTRIHLSGKSSPVSAATFAAGYLDRRQKKNRGREGEWRCGGEGEGEDMWWQGRLAMPEREDLLVAR